jgi:3-oxoacyl-[acyl-carrier protein] reductase
MTLELKGKFAVVTGGGRDIGRAISVELARRGANVVVNYRSSEAEARETVREIERMDRKAIAVHADVTRKEEVDRLTSEASRFGGGRIDILVNNAGGMVRRARLVDLTESLMAEAITLNLMSAVLMCQAVAPHMLKQREGRIVNVSSVAGHNGGGASAPHYSAAKAALSNLGRSLTREFGSSGVVVNTVAPGLIDNRFNVEHTPPEMFGQIVKNIPLGRAGTNEEVATVVAFLASPAAAYVAGEVIHVNGGLHFGS